MADMFLFLSFIFDEIRKLKNTVSIKVKIRYMGKIILGPAILSVGGTSRENGVRGAMEQSQSPTSR